MAVLQRIGILAHNTLRAAARQRLFHLIILLAFALVLGARWFREFNFGAPELKFLADCGLGAMGFFGAALAITATGQLFFHELETRTAQTILAKPVRRSEFILGKLLGVGGLLLGFCVALALLLIAVLWSRESELMQQLPEAFENGRQVNYAGVLLAGALQWLKLIVLASLTLLVASFAQSQLFSVLAGFAILAIGHLQHLAHDAYRRSASAAVRLLGGAVVSAFPRFDIFGVADGLDAGLPAGSDIARVVAYGLGYAGIACALAIFSFGRREI